MSINLGYYFIKVVFLVLIAFPKIKISNLAFYYVVIPALDALNAYIGSHHIPSALGLLRLIPLISIILMFPNLVYDQVVRIYNIYIIIGLYLSYLHNIYKQNVISRMMRKQ